jgi:hypothetical protein
MKDLSVPAETVVRGPVYIPLSVVVSTVLLIVTVVVSFTVIRVTQDAQAGELNRMRDRQTELARTEQAVGKDIVFIKTVLTMKYPDLATRAAAIAP